MAASIQKRQCLVNHREHRITDGDLLKNLNSSVIEAIRKEFPDAKPDDFICNEHQVKFRLSVMDQLFQLDLQKNFDINNQLSEKVQSADYQIHNVEDQLEAQATLGERIADKVTDFVGSWIFIISYVSILIIWMFLNVTKILFGACWDAYPFILLNLFLSITAALQAPLIMMSQNRASDHDRLTSKNDFQTNIKSENGISAVNEKLDHLMMDDQPTEFQIQKIQTEMLGDIQILLNEVYHQTQDIKERLNTVEDKIKAADRKQN